MTIVTPEKRAKFISSLAEGASITEAAKSAGVCRMTVYRLRESDPDFAEAWDDALEAGTDLIEDEALRRATKGTLKPVFHKGEHVGDIREYSDTLTIFLLKGRRPDKYRDNAKVEHSGEIGIAGVVRVPAKQSKEEWAQKQAERQQLAQQKPETEENSETNSNGP